MVMLYLIGFLLSLFINLALNEGKSDYLESKGYILKNRLEKIKRCASGNIVEYSLTKEDILSKILDNLICFIPGFNFIYSIAMVLKLEHYKDDDENMWRKSFQKMLDKEEIVNISKEEYEQVHMIEDELKRLRKEKIVDFLTNLGIDIKISEIEEDEENALDSPEFEDEFEEEFDDEFEEDEELEEEEEDYVDELGDQSTIEIKINTPCGTKRYYRVIDSRRKKIHVEVDPEEDDLDRIMGVLDRVFDRADRKIDQALDAVDKKVDTTLDKFDQTTDKVIDKIDSVTDTVVDKFDSVTDTVVDKVDKVIDKILKL